MMMSSSVGGVEEVFLSMMTLGLNGALKERMLDLREDEGVVVDGVVSLLHIVEAMFCLLGVYVWASILRWRFTELGNGLPWY